MSDYEHPLVWLASRLSQWLADRWWFQSLIERLSRRS